MSLQKLQLIDTNGLRLNLSFAGGRVHLVDSDRTSQASTTKEEQEPFLRPQSPEPFEDPREVPPLNVKKRASATAPTAPPNGGLTAWLQVLGAHFLFFNSW
jgi:hypothetical protein